MIGSLLISIDSMITAVVVSACEKSRRLSPIQAASKKSVVNVAKEGDQLAGLEAHCEVTEDSHNHADCEVSYDEGDPTEEYPQTVLCAV